MIDPVGTYTPRIDFGHVADDYEITRGIPADFMKTIMQDIITTSNLKSGDLVLEMGCGAGRFLREFADRKNPVVGIDISKGMLDKAYLNQKGSKYLRSNLIASDAISLPFHAGLFKGIIAIHLFHLFADWQQALTEAIRVLQPDGSLVTGFIGGLTHGSFLHRLYHQRRDELGYSTKRPGAHPSQVRKKLEEQNAMIETHKFDTSVEVPLRVTLSYLERRVFSSMWHNLPDVIHRQIMQYIDTVATSQFKDLDDKEQIQIKAELLFASF